MGRVGRGQLVARRLKKEGVRHVFTLSGLYVAPIDAACVEEGIAIIDTRHERAAAHAADAHARLTRGPGVAVVRRAPAPATLLAPTRYDKVVEAFGGHGEYVTEPSQHRPALERRWPVARWRV